MSRREKTSPAEDVMATVALLPWWVAVALAPVLYLALHHVASQAVAAATQSAQVGAMVTQTVWRALESVVQYALPLICLAGVGISAWRRRERQPLIASLSQCKAADVLDGMTWQAFERLAGETFRLPWYRVAETDGGGSDGRVDLGQLTGGVSLRRAFRAPCRDGPLGAARRTCCQQGESDPI